MLCGTYNVVEHYEKRIKILHSCPFEGWPNRAWPIQPISRYLPKRVGWPCPVRSALKRTPVQDFNSFSISIYYIISTTFQKLRDLFYSLIILDFCTVCLVWENSTVLEIFLQDFVGNALDLINSTKLEIFWQDFCRKSPCFGKFWCLDQEAFDSVEPLHIFFTNLRYLESLKVKHRSGKISIDYYMKVDLG